MLIVVKLLALVDIGVAVERRLRFMIPVWYCLKAGLYFFPFEERDRERDVVIVKYYTIGSLSADFFDLTDLAEGVLLKGVREFLLRLRPSF